MSNVINMGEMPQEMFEKAMGGKGTFIMFPMHRPSFGSAKTKSVKSSTEPRLGEKMYPEREQTREQVLATPTPKTDLTDEQMREIMKNF